MHGFLLSMIALSSPLTCEDAIHLLDTVRPSVNHYDEIVETIKVNTEEGCEFETHKLTEGTD